MTADVTIPLSTGQGEIAATLAVPGEPAGLVVFAHGSGSSRHSARNRFVADALQARGHATLLLDLLTPEEEVQDQPTGRWRFDIPLLADRLKSGCVWAETEPAVAGLPLGLFGASTGAAAALLTAAEPGVRAKAMVSRGGRPDLAGQVLPLVQAPTLLIVGGDDEPVLGLNRDAAQVLPHAEVAVVAGATHLFPEPGALERVAGLAGDWFDRHLRSA
ncbi:MAG: hydrolase [Hamadaea sp.]|nr:hydrolase [Hamadaea sp.]